ncbi:MAG TPA: hypothetical protein VFW22_14440 [Pseudolabrys sp.]|nr:hypothetical protein [Pseudolabrys sp.]
MRISLKTTIGICALGALSLASAANAAPFYHRYTDGSWTNAEYNDGICHYSYSHNAYDGETHVNRYGDCSQIAIGPNGEAMRMNAMPVAPPPY